MRVRVRVQARRHLAPLELHGLLGAHHLVRVRVRVRVEVSVRVGVRVRVRVRFRGRVRVRVRERVRVRVRVRARARARDRVGAPACRRHSAGTRTPSGSPG